MTDPAEAALVARARQGDLIAFEGVVRRYQATVVGYAGSILRDVHAAEDARGALEGTEAASREELETLTAACEAAREAGSWSSAARRDAAEGIGTALACERKAIEAIREVIGAVQTEEGA